MATALSDEELSSRYNVYCDLLREGFSDTGRPSAVMELSRRLGINRTTALRSVKDAKERFGLPNETTNKTVSCSQKPYADDIDLESLINYKRQLSKRKIANFAARKSVNIKINSTEPIVIASIGDPHLDDDSCDFEQLEKDVNFLKLPYVWAINIGDTTNNWTGRLMRLYAHQETGLKGARMLIKWFMRDAGINWLLWLIGNHDEWEQGAALLELMNTDKIIMENWQCKIKLDFPNGFQLPIWASHNFKGQSQYNQLHGSMKANLMQGYDCRVFMSGHLHNFAMHVEPCQHTGQLKFYMRSRGYKMVDTYADTNGFFQGRIGATTAIVVDPRAPEGQEVNAFYDLESAVKFRNAIL